MTKTFHQKVADIQANLIAPKGQTNKFGGYKYRSCEDILEAVKPLLGDLVLTLNDEVALIGERYYIKATATITDGTHAISNTAYAREADVKKGMDESQITGTASSYSRKYALNGLLVIDDQKDHDTNELAVERANKPAEKAPAKKADTKKANTEKAKDELIAAINGMTKLDHLASYGKSLHDDTAEAGKAFASLSDEQKAEVRKAYGVTSDKLKGAA